MVPGIALQLAYYHDLETAGTLTREAAQKQALSVVRYLFVLMAEAVIFAMIFSFILSRALVLTMAKYLLQAHPATVDEHGQHIEQPAPKTFLGRFQQGFVNRFETFRAGYSGVLHLALEHRKVFVVGFLSFVVLSFALLPGLGSNFFPDVDGGQILVHARVPPPVGGETATGSCWFCRAAPARLRCC